MRQSLLSRLAKRSKRQGQVGQTIVIMAFGFIVLLAFVGIVTDVSLMFVRYTTLRRAVDAAAVAAAGQVRRTLPTQAELTKAGNNVTVANGYAFARNIVNINLAARQFIEFYGLSPSNVSVDSCDTLTQNPAPSADDIALQQLLECGNSKQPRKMVRVTAQLQSPTVFLRLIGWQTVTLEASAISETAVLDVVLIFDTAETMLKQTTYNDWKTVPKTDAGGSVIYKADGTVDTQDKSLRYLPVRVNRGPNWLGTAGDDALYRYWPAAFDSAYNANLYQKAWTKLLNTTQSQLYPQTGNDPAITPYFPEIAFTWDGTTATKVDGNTDTRAPRQDCRVRFFPYAELTGPNAMKWQVTGAVTVATDLQNSYNAILKKNGKTQVFGDTFDGFIPAYDYYGCCNDPNGDNKFDDLICQPFKKVRDATEKFLDHVDFVRGDRVAFVTFDKTAYLIDPDGEKGPQLPMITAQNNAVAALRRIVGVRAEPYYYADTDTPTDGEWNSMVTGASAYTGAAGGGVPITYAQRYDFAKKAWVDNTTATDGLAGYNNTKLGALNDYPVRYNCYWENATMTYPFSLYSSEATQANITAYSLPYYYDSSATVVASRWPTPLAAMTGTPMMNPNLNLTTWDNSMKSYNAEQYGRQAAKPLFSYEFRAGCAGNNVGAALRVGNNALLDPRTVRIGNTGAVWVMVLLGDGAAGASDPVIRNGASIPSGYPYGKFTDNPKPGGYGAYGLCPYGAVDDQMSLTAGWQTRPPRCSDDGSEPSNGGTRGIMGPVSRHFCKNSAVGVDSNANIDIGVSGELTSDCATKYDVDDYARDWADFIGLQKLPCSSPFGKLPGEDCSKIRSLLQLPTIFTIGFGLDFTEDPVGQCSNSTGALYTNINDCLGEELLRYIADVGDNNRLDTDYQQDWVNDGSINGSVDDPPNVGGPNFYGDRGPCEAALPTYGNADSALAAGGIGPGNFKPLFNNPLPPKTSCGNYYNAPGGPELTKVFEDIASRMFTRITK